MKENQGEAESPFELVTHAYGISMRHLSEANKRTMTIPSQIEEAVRKLLGDRKK